MSFSTLFARGVALIGGAALQMRRLTEGSPEPAWGSAPAIPTAKPQGSIPTLKMPTAKGWDAGRTPIAAPGLKVNAFAGGLDHPRWIEVLPNGDVLIAEALSLDRPARSVFDYAMITTMRRADGRGGKRQPHHAVARQGRRRRRRDPRGVPREPEPAVRDGAGGRHVLCRQHGRRGRLSLHGRRQPHHRARPQARHVQARRPLDAKPPAEPRQTKALRRRRIAHQYRRAGHGGGGRPCRHL